MDYLKQLSLIRIFVTASILTIVSFFSLLIVANVTSRKGIEEIGVYQRDISDSEAKISQLEGATATYSSLLRIEKRAREMGLGPAKKTEYLK
jgi:hypothetical protein